MKKGFTLVELLVVIAIIALLSTLSVVALNSARAKSRDARRQSDIRQIRTALELYYDANNQQYPTGSNKTLGTGDAACLNQNGWVSTSACASATIFMQNVLTDPIPGTYSYIYNVGGSGATYTIAYNLENGGPKTATPYSME